MGDETMDPVQEAQDRLAKATAALKEAEAAHADSETAHALADAQAVHAQVKAVHDDLTAPQIEPDKHVLVAFGGTTDPVPVDIPDGSIRDSGGCCRERTLRLNGVTVEHVAEVFVKNQPVWVYREQ